jgi:hypothetical protein
VQVFGAKPEDLSVAVPLVLGIAVPGEVPVPELLALGSAEAWGEFGSQGVHIHRLPVLITAEEGFLSRFVAGPDDCSDFSQCLDYFESQLFAGHASLTFDTAAFVLTQAGGFGRTTAISGPIGILPEPSTALLMGLGLIGLRVCGRRRPSC